MYTEYILDGYIEEEKKTFTKVELSFDTNNCFGLK